MSMRAPVHLARERRSDDGIAKTERKSTRHVRYNMDGAGASFALLSSPHCFISFFLFFLSFCAYHALCLGMLAYPFFFFCVVIVHLVLFTISKGLVK